MTKLSVNINKVATLRNARGGNLPNVLQVALDCEKFGAQGITVHPRPDERHIRYQDVYDLKPVLSTEFNIEGNPEQKFMDLVLAVKPHQVTLVPDAHDALTSNHGWDTKTYKNYLTDIINELHKLNIRTSIFVDPVKEMVETAALTGTDRIELYTEAYAYNYSSNRENAIAPFVEAAAVARKLELGINAGHDLNLDNLKYFHSRIDGLLEVSIGHALIADALYYGLSKTIQLYLNELK
jgi:pyridoxine 5-phosphate synthase